MQIYSLNLEARTAYSPEFSRLLENTERALLLNCAALHLLSLLASSNSVVTYIS